MSSISLRVFFSWDLNAITRRSLSILSQIPQTSCNLERCGSRCRLILMTVGIGISSTSHPFQTARADSSRVLRFRNPLGPRGMIGDFATSVFLVPFIWDVFLLGTSVLGEAMAFGGFSLVNSLCRLTEARPPSRMSSRSSPLVSPDSARYFKPSMLTGLSSSCGSLLTLGCLATAMSVLPAVR